MRGPHAPHSNHSEVSYNVNHIHHPVAPPGDSLHLLGLTRHTCHDTRHIHPPISMLSLTFLPLASKWILEHAKHTLALESCYTWKPNAWRAHLFTSHTWRWLSEPTSPRRLTLAASLGHTPLMLPSLLPVRDLRQCPVHSDRPRLFAE